ncbi:MAG: hypothetical protein ACRC51_07940 [Cetobacterium sp.]
MEDQLERLFAEIAELKTELTTLGQRIPEPIKVPTTSEILGMNREELKGLTMDELKMAMNSEVIVND